MPASRSKPRWIGAAWMLLAAACTDADAPHGDGDAGDDPRFALSSPALAQGGAFAARHACWGENLSPPLEWRNAPTATRSYAVVMTDLDIELVHWVIWDISADRSALPEGIENVFEPEVPAGAKQTESYRTQTRGYLGPCPPERHRYEFALHALDVATLPALGAQSVRDEVTAAIAGHAIGEARLTGSGERP